MNGYFVCPSCTLMNNETFEKKTNLDKLVDVLHDLVESLEIVFRCLFITPTYETFLILNSFMTEAVII